MQWKVLEGIVTKKSVISKEGRGGSGGYGGGRKDIFTLIGNNVFLRDYMLSNYFVIEINFNTLIDAIGS